MYKMFMLLIRLPVNRRLLVVEFLGGQNCKWVFSLHGWRGTVNDPNPHFVQKSAVLLGMLGWLSWFLISAQDAISGVWDQVFPLPSAPLPPCSLFLLNRKKVNCTFIDVILV